MVAIAQLDVAYVGGITKMKKIAAIAERYQVSIALHNTKDPVGISTLITDAPSARELLRAARRSS